MQRNNSGLGPAVRCVLVALMFGFLAAMIFGLPGCSPDQVAQLKQTRDEVAQVIQDGRQTAEQLQVQAQALPDNDPLRKQILQAIDQTLKVTAEAEKRLPLLDAAIKSAESGQVDPSLVSEASKLPYVGPYASLAAALGGLAFGVYQRIQKARTQQAATEIVQSVEAALPERTESQKAVMRSHQSASTQAVVSRIKGD